jgi:Fe-S-cluster containining protein
VADADRYLDAGPFSSWLEELQTALSEGHDVDVPCDGCTACCTSSQFIHVTPDETETLARIPKALLAPAPGLPRGHVVMGYDERGHCPMLVDGVCSIYEHRPRTCRTYDCRVFAATGIDVEADGKPLISERSRRWRFDFESDADRSDYDALRTVAESLDEDLSATHRAVLAIRQVRTARAT